VPIASKCSVLFVHLKAPDSHADHIHMHTINWCQASPSDMFLGSILCCLVQCCQLCGPQLTCCAADGDVYPLIRYCALQGSVASSICGTGRSQCLLQECSTLTLQLCSMLSYISGRFGNMAGNITAALCTRQYASVATQYLETFLHAGAPASLQAGVVK